MEPALYTRHCPTVASLTSLTSSSEGRSCEVQATCPSRSFGLMVWTSGLLVNDGSSRAALESIDLCTVVKKIGWKKC